MTLQRSLNLYSCAVFVCGRNLYRRHVIISFCYYLHFFKQEVIRLYICLYHRIYDFTTALWSISSIYISSGTCVGDLIQSTTSISVPHNSHQNQCKKKIIFAKISMLKFRNQLTNCNLIKYSHALERFQNQLIRMRFVAFTMHDKCFNLSRSFEWNRWTKVQTGQISSECKSFLTV